MIPDIPAIREAQADFQKSIKTRLIEFRISVLQNLESEIQRRESEILGALAADLGKPKIEAYLSEIYFLLTEIRLFRKKLKRWAKPKRVGNPFYFFPARSEIRHEPFGCTLILAPWNYPIQLSLSPLIAAIAAGNCVILKPSEIAPATAQILAEIVAAAFDPGHITVVQGDAAVSEKLLAEKFDFIFYTGSEKVGKIVAEAAAKNLTPAVLELGGKCPVIVDDDPEILDLAAERIAAGKFFNAGQTCISPDFVIALGSSRDALATKIREHVEKFYTENPQADFAKIVSDDHFDRLDKMAVDAEKIGDDNPETRHLAPRLIADADWNHPAMQEEIFGPILPILTCPTADEAIEKLSKFSSPLALYLFSKNRDFHEKFAAALPSGSIGINDVMKQATNLDLPFGGVGASGYGRYRGRFGFETFSYQRAVTRRFFTKDRFTIHPPYAGKFEKFRRFLK